jgi:hypothetical protein
MFESGVAILEGLSLNSGFDSKGPTKMSGESYYVQRSSAFYSRNLIAHASSFRGMGKQMKKIRV